MVIAGRGRGILKAPAVGSGNSIQLMKAGSSSHKAGPADPTAGRRLRLSPRIALRNGMRRDQECK